MSNPLENSKWEVLEGGQETRDCRACTTGMVGQRRCEHPGALALCVACTGPPAGVQGTRRWDSPLAGRVVPTCPQDPGPRAGGRAGCVLRSPREAVSATLTCACMSTVVRTGRDAKAADWVPVSRDPRPLMGSRHATPEPDGPGARAPATPATFEFQPSRCKLAAQSAEANPRRRRRREPITVPSASGTTPPESGLLSSDQAREPDSLDPTSGSALPLVSLSSFSARSSLHFRSAS